jgi:hypothetical protein
MKYIRVDLKNGNQMTLPIDIIFISKNIKSGWFYIGTIYNINDMFSITLDEYTRINQVIFKIEREAKRQSDSFFAKLNSDEHPDNSTRNGAGT